jgi:hypothetical protein
LQKYFKSFKENPYLQTPLACADFSTLLQYYQDIQPARLLNLILKNSFTRNLIFENSSFISFLSAIKQKALSKTKKCFDSNRLLSNSFDNIFKTSSNLNISLAVFKDFDILFTILKFRQCNKYLKGSREIIQPETSSFLLFLVRHCFISLPKKGKINKNHLNDLRSILGNILALKLPFLSEDVARGLFQASLKFISQCNLAFSKNSKKLMLLLIKVAISLIQKFLTNFPSKPNEHRKKILFMGQKLSSPPFAAFFKSVNEERLKFQLLKFTN